MFLNMKKRKYYEMERSDRVDNMEKRNRYATLMVDLKKSIENHYYYEAIFIEYAILEDRTDSLLRHAGIKKGNYTLSQKINIIWNNKVFKDDYVKLHINKELLDLLKKWKNMRNKLIHDLVKVKYGNSEIAKVALNGYDIVKMFNNKSTLVNKYFDKCKEKVVQ